MSRPSRKSTGAGPAARFRASVESGLNTRSVRPCMAQSTTPCSLRLISTVSRSVPGSRANVKAFAHAAPALSFVVEKSTARPGMPPRALPSLMNVDRIAPGVTPLNGRLPSTITLLGYSTTLRSCHDQPGQSYDRAPVRSVLSLSRLIRRNRPFIGSVHGPPATEYCTASSQCPARKFAPTPAAGYDTFSDGTSFSGDATSNPRYCGSNPSWEPFGA